MSFVYPFVHQSIPLFALVFSAKYLSKCTSAVWVLVRQYVYLHVCYSTSSPFNIFNSLRKLRKGEIKNHVLLPCVITQQFLSPSLRIWSVNYIFCHPFILSSLCSSANVSNARIILECVNTTNNGGTLADAFSAAPTDAVQSRIYVYVRFMFMTTWDYT